MVIGPWDASARITKTLRPIGDKREGLRADLLDKTRQETFQRMATDHLRIMCPSLSCRKVLAVPVASRGKNVRCKNCGATIRVPEKPPQVAPVAPPPEAKGDAPKDPKAKQAA